MNPDIYSFVKSEETKFETEEIQVGENWYWNFRRHVQMIFHLKNGIFFTGENDYLRAFKNIYEPILNLAYWTEDLEVKDTTFFIEGKDDRVMSFLIKKYHDEVYSREHDLDLFFDEVTESDIDYGGVLVQKGVKRPEVIKLKKVAFCDQTDILGGAIGFKYNFSPSKLKQMSKYGWGKESNGATMDLDTLCTLATFEKEPSGALSDKRNKVPSKTIEVYVVRGNLPEHYLLDNDNMDYWFNQVQIIAFYTDKDSKQQGVTLYRKKADEDDLLFFTSKEVEDRALGRGYGESLIHPQVWTNFLTIHKMNMLEAGSKVPLWTDDETYTTKNKIQEMENLEVTVVAQGRRIGQVPTVAPANVQLFEREVNDWFNYAQISNQANDPILGVEATSGTTFRGQERTVAQGRGSHDRKRGKRAKFIEEVYRKMIIPDIVKEISKGKEFLATLSNEEINWVSEKLAVNYATSKLMEDMFNGKLVTKEMQDQMIEQYKQDFLKKGSKHLLKILKGELQDASIRMGINIANKQKNLANLSDKILSIFQFVFTNPQGFQQAMQIPALAKAFEDILEYSGMSSADFSTFMSAPQMQQIQNESPLQTEQLLTTQEA